LRIFSHSGGAGLVESVGSLIHDFALQLFRCAHVLEVSQSTGLESLIEDLVGSDYAVDVKRGKAEIYGDARHTELVFLGRKNYSTIRGRLLLSVVVKRILTPTIPNYEPWLARPPEKTVVQDAHDIGGTSDGPCYDIAQVFSKAVGRRPDMHQPNGFRKQFAAYRRDGERKKHTRQHSTAVVGIVKRRIIMPEGSIEEPIRLLGLRRQHESATYPCSPGADLKIEGTDIVWPSKPDACDLPGDMTHVVSTERAIHSSEVAGPLLLD
jgi:hypothetical protein